ncbi:nuclear transport factor 2 family protein [Streptomyces sp. A5-4]|uniref:nuclear transport factor 2 family protein n=1 Tax=Streptomyces sp. A5-4 TaxID=3384771 RepID=UPI003DAA0EA4
MGHSGGSFRLVQQDVMVNGGLVAVTVRFSAARAGREPIDMDGVDVLRVTDGKIAEMWLFSAAQDAEDAFWA